MKRARYAVGDRVELFEYEGAYGDGALGVVVDVQYVVVITPDGSEKIAKIRYIVEIDDDYSKLDGECVIAYEDTMEGGI